MLTSRRTRTRRGYTLLELVVVIAVTGSLLLLLVAWVAGLMRASTTSLGLTMAARDGDYVLTQMQTDLTAAATCNAFGYGTPYHTTGVSLLYFYADVVDGTGADGADGNMDLVMWEVAAGKVKRAVVKGTGPCNFDISSPGWKTLAQNVKALGTGQAHFIFTRAVTDSLYGQATWYGSCQTSNAEKCKYETVGLTIIFESAAGVASPTYVSKSFEVDLSTSAV